MIQIILYFVCLFFCLRFFPRNKNDLFKLKSEATTAEVIEKELFSHVNHALVHQALLRYGFTVPHIDDRTVYHCIAQ